MMKWCPGRVASKHVWAEGLFTLHVEVDGIAPFVPGQFLQLSLERDGHRVHRPYSVASPPGEVLEFYIVMVENGALTPHLWSMEAGSEVDVSEHAAGSFTLAKTPDADNLWLFATGTGLAPYIAMLRTDEPWRRYKKIVVVHGVRHAEHLSYADELNSYHIHYPDRLHYVPTISRGQIGGTLDGRITHILSDGRLEKFTGIDLLPEHSAVMLCGNPQMLDEMEHILEQRGMQKHRNRNPGHYVIERYW